MADERPRPEWWEVVEATERWARERTLEAADRIKERNLRGQEQG